MLLKRIYDPASIGVTGVVPKCIGVQLRHTGTTLEQNFTPPLVAAGAAEGWLRWEGDSYLVLCAINGLELRYQVKRTPGYYCCHNGERMPISSEGYADGAIGAVEARKYLQEHGFRGKKSPDPDHPAGYMRLNCYECVLDVAQHELFKAVPGALAPSMKAEG